MSIEEVAQRVNSMNHQSIIYLNILLLRDDHKICFAARSGLGHGERNDPGVAEVAERVGEISTYEEFQELTAYLDGTRVIAAQASGPIKALILPPEK